MLSMVRESKFTRWHSRSIVTPSSRKQISLHAWLTEERLCSLYIKRNPNFDSCTARDQNIFNDDKKDDLSLSIS